MVDDLIIIKAKQRKNPNTLSVPLWQIFYFFIKKNLLFRNHIRINIKGVK